MNCPHCNSLNESNTEVCVWCNSRFDSDPRDSTLLRNPSRTSEPASAPEPVVRSLPKHIVEDLRRKAEEKQELTANHLTDDVDLVCRKCHTENQAIAKFCMNCGDKLEPIMIPAVPIQTSNSGDSQTSYMPNDLFDNMVVLSLKAILIREYPRDLGYVRENFKTHESFVSGLIGLYDLKNFRSEIPANSKYQIMTASRTLADIYQGVDKTSDVDHTTYMPSVIWSCEYYFDKYNKEFDRSGEKKGFLKRTFRGTAFNRNPNLDPNRVRNSIEAIKQALAIIRIGSIRI